MDADALLASLQRAVPGAQVERGPSIDAQATVFVAPADLPAVARALRDAPDLAFDFLAELTAVDYWPHAPRYELVYLLVSIANRQRLRMKVRLAPAGTLAGSAGRSAKLNTEPLELIVSIRKAEAEGLLTWNWIDTLAPALTEGKEIVPPGDTRAGACPAIVY